VEEKQTLVTDEGGTRLQLSWPWWRWILTGLNTLALVLSVILSWHYLAGGSMIGCNAGSPCNQVLNSQWSMIAGVLPISGLAVGAYLALFTASLFIGPTTEAPIRRIAWSAMLILVGSVAGSAVWFTFVQRWIIGEFCLYCISIHITGLLLASLVIWRAIMEFDNHSNDIPLTNPAKDQNDSSIIPWRINRILPAMGKSIIGLVLAGILAAVQIGFTPPAVYRDGESQDNLPVIDYHMAPMIGSPDAHYVVVLLFDYQCPHCQKLHLMLNEVVRRFSGKLAFALCPTPLNTQCNPYIPRDVDEFTNSCELVKIGLAVWVAKRDTFSDFDNWMFTFESGDTWRPRSLESARAKAVEFVGQKKFDTVLADPWIERYIQTCIRIYGQTVQGGKGGIPKLIFGSRWVIPEPNNADGLVMILRKSLAVPYP
jgi:uncharacterized membrane protein